MRTKTRKSKGVVWAVDCKMCGRPFSTPISRQTLEDLPDMNGYQCPVCGESAEYSRGDHHPTAA